MLDITLYIAAVVLANLTADTFFALPVFGLVAVGTLFFGATFTLRDRLHARLGRRVYLVIATAAILTLLIGSWYGVPLRIVAASFLAIVCAEAADTEIYHQIRHRVWSVRVLSSNAVSIPIDTVLFTLLAFLGVFSGSVLVQIIVGDIIVKFCIGAVIAVWPPRSSSVAVATLGSLRLP